jgi:alpha-N-acetylglucosamine transferase
MRFSISWRYKGLSGNSPAFKKKADESLLPTDFVFAARSDNALTGERNHPFPPLQNEVFSAGTWLAAPSTELIEYFLSVMNPQLCISQRRAYAMERTPLSIERDLA